MISELVDLHDLVLADVVQKTLLGKLAWLESGNVPFLVRGNTSIYTSMGERKVSIAMIFSLESKKSKLFKDRGKGRFVDL